MSKLSLENLGNRTTPHKPTLTPVKSITCILQLWGKFLYMYIYVWKGNLKIWNNAKASDHKGMNFIAYNFFYYKRSAPFTCTISRTATYISHNKSNMEKKHKKKALCNQILLYLSISTYSTRLNYKNLLPRDEEDIQMPDWWEQPYKHKEEENPPEFFSFFFSLTTPTKRKQPI